MKGLVVDIFVEWPMPVVWLMLIGLLARVLWRRGRTLVAFAALFMVVGSVPAVGRLLLWPLGQVPAYAGPQGLDAIVVPTAGVFVDRRGEWWSSENSLLRLAHGRSLQEESGLPLYVAGGVVANGAPAEARVLIDRAALDPADVRLEETARNTAETGAAIAELLAQSTPSPGAAPQCVVVVTNPAHVMRMTAALRRHGVKVVASPIGNRAGGRMTGLLAVVPSWPGLLVTGDALYEYAGLAWYLVRGHIRPRDLVRGPRVDQDPVGAARE